MPLPTGPAVAFLFTDIEGSTRLERTVGSVAWAGIVARHDALLRAAIEGHRGVVVKTEGDAFFAAFDDALAATQAAVEAQRALAMERWPDDQALRVRMGIHLGEGRLRASGSGAGGGGRGEGGGGRGEGEPEDYVGIDVNYAARITAAANGGQVVLSAALVERLPPQLADRPGLTGVLLVDDGERAVKDFDEPAELFRLVVPGAADDERPLRTSEVPSNLPGDVTTLVGREEEVEHLAEDLRESRIVTLSGPGGSGKTRLALAVARSIRDRFPHGVWFVDLAAVRDATLVPPAVASTLGVRESVDRTVDEALRVHLRERTALLLLDNLEQLLPKGADVVAGMARSAPRIRLLVTSRELLRIAGEQGRPVPPLDLEAGVALFVDRARASRPDLALGPETLAAIRAICERLDGLPLALELAAARVRLLSPALILERLGRSIDLGGGARDLPERQRTLRAAMAWSHDLLTPEERRLFARLGVFASGWTAEAALAVTDPDGQLGLDPLAGLESLADKSLVRVEPGGLDAGGHEVETRFSFHPLIREYALERLEESGERPAAEERFVRVCVALAEESGGAILTKGGETSMRRLDREDHNMRAAADWTLAHGAPDLGLRIMGAIWRWFQQRGRLREARALLAELLGRATDVDVRVRIRALAAEGGLAYWMNDFPGARAAYSQRLDLASGTGDDVLLADAHYDLGFLSMVSQDAATLREHESRALELYEAAGDEAGAVRARQALVLAVFLAGDYAGARDLEGRNLEVFQRSGSPLQVADSLTLLSAVHWRLGDPVASWHRLSEALELFIATDSASGLARALGMAAIVLLHDGDAEAGAEVAGTTYALVREKGVMLAPVKVLHLPDPAEVAVERLGADRAAELMAAGEQVPVAEMVARVRAMPPPGSEAPETTDG